MRIVAHNGASLWGGAERATVLLLQSLAERGHEVRLLCNSELVASRARDRGIQAKICVIGGDLMLPHAVRLAHVLRSAAPDAFIVGTYRKLFLAALGARIARVPRIVARIGLETDTPRSAKYRFALRHWTDGVAVNAARIVAPFAEMQGFGPDKVELIPNGVLPPVRRSAAGAVRRELGIPEYAFVIGTVARLASQKRLDRLLEIVSALPADLHCIIAGDGEERGSLSALAHTLGVQERVHFMGERDDTADILDALDVFTVTSDREGLSNSMLEAMSCGIAVVSTPVSGADDALVPDDGGEAAGIICDFTPQSIATAIQALRADPERRKALGEVGRAKAADTFSMSTMAGRWEEFLQPRAR